MKNQIIEEKSEIEKLVDKIYHKQTYGKDIDKDLKRLNELCEKKPKQEARRK